MNSEEVRKRQAELQKAHLERDRGKTFGHDAKDHCKLEKAMSLQCIESNYDNQDKCKIFFDNYKSCSRFWRAVQSFRVRELKRFDQISEEELKAYKKQLPNWLETQKIHEPDM